MCLSKFLTLEDKLYIRQHIEIDSIDDIAVSLQKSKWQVRNYLKSLPAEMVPPGILITKPPASFFTLTDEEKQEIQELIMVLSVTEVANKMVKSRAKVLKYLKSLPNWSEIKAHKRNALSDADKAHITAHYRRPLHRLSAELDKSKSSIYAFMCSLPEYIAFQKEKQDFQLRPLVGDPAPATRKQERWPTIYSNHHGGKAPALNNWAS